MAEFDEFVSYLDQQQEPSDFDQFLGFLDQENRGFFNNAARGVGERASELGGALSSFVSQAGNWLDERASLGGFTWEGALPEYRPPSEWRAMKESGQITDTLAEVGQDLKDTDFGYKARHTWDSTKKAWDAGFFDGLGETLKFGVESGVHSLPDMVAAVTALPAYIASRSEEIGQERAFNKGKQEADFQETLEAAPFAIGSALLERIVPRGFMDKLRGENAKLVQRFGENAMDYAMRRAKKVLADAGVGATQEAFTEALQEGLIEYAGERFGTDAKMSFSEALDRAAGGAVGGAFGGAAIGGMGGAAQQFIRKEQVAGIDRFIQGGSLDLESEIENASGLADNLMESDANLLGRGPAVSPFAESLREFEQDDYRTDRIDAGVPIEEQIQRLEEIVRQDEEQLLSSKFQPSTLTQVQGVPVSQESAKAVEQDLAWQQRNREIEAQQMSTQEQVDLDTQEAFIRSLPEPPPPNLAMEDAFRQARQKLVAEQERVKPEEKIEEKPAILSQTKAQYLKGLETERGLKKGSPGYAAARKDLEAEYEEDLNKAQAALSFEEFNALNPDTPENLNRQAWTALREDFDIKEPEKGYNADQEVNNEQQASNIQRGKDLLSSSELDIQGDLFSSPELSGEQRRARVADKFKVKYQQVETGQVKSGAKKVSSPADAAHTIAPFRKHGQETFLVLITDENKKPLTVLRHTKGVKDGSQVDPGEVIGAIAATEGAKHVWFAHNHPSGQTIPSAADNQITEVLKGLMDGLDIDYRGHIIVAPGNPRAHWIPPEYDADTAVNVRIKPLPRSQTVSVSEKMLRKREPGGFAQVTNGESAIEAAKSIESQHAIMLLNAQHHHIGQIDLTTEEMLKLRDGVQVPRLFKSLHDSNAGAVIIKTTGDRAANTDPVKNLSKFFNRPGMNTRLLDWINIDEKGEGVSDARWGSTYKSEGVFFKKPQEKSTGGPPVPIKGALQKFEKETGVKANVVKTNEDLPQHLQDQMKEFGWDGLHAVYDNINDQTYIISGNLGSVQDGIKAYLHEVVGHKGIRAALGDKLNTTLDDIYNSLSPSERVAIEANYEDQLTHKDMDPQDAKRIVVEEYIAKLAETDPKHSIVQRVVAAIRAWLRERFPNMRWTDNDIIGILERGRKNLKNQVQLSEAVRASIAPQARKVVGTNPVIAGWTLLAQGDEVFQVPTSRAQSLEGVFEDVGGDLYVERFPHMDQDRKAWKIKQKGSRRFGMVFVKNNTVWIDVSSWGKGGGGHTIYSAVANYAHNTGKTFIGDPAGLSDTGMARRLENMVSSALKFGTTDHLWPHERQQSGARDIPPLKWKDGDFSNNLTEMIKASYTATVRQIPDIKGILFNPESGEFELNGEVVTDEDFANIAASARESAGVGKDRSGQTAPVQITAGSATLKRAILSHTLARATREEQSRILAAIGGQPGQRTPDRLRNILYSVGQDPYRELEDSLKEKNKGFLYKAKQIAKRELNPAGLLPQPVFDAKIQRDIGFNLGEFDISHGVGGLRRAVRDAYGKSYPSLSDEQKLAINAFLAGESVDLPDQVKVAVMKMRNDIDKLSREYVQILREQLLDMAGPEINAENFATEASETMIAKAELLNTIVSNVGRYLHRSYRAFDDPKWPSKVPDNVMENAKRYLEERYANGGEVTNAVKRKVADVIDLILREGTAYEDMESFIKESKLGAKDLTVLIRRKEIAPQIRALLGEYKDAEINYARTLTKMNRLIFNQRFLDRVLEQGMGTFLFDKDSRPIGATTKIAAEGSKVMEPLNGLYTYPEIEKAFRDALDPDNTDGWLRMIIQMNGMVKYGKTVLSPTTALRNFWSASFFAMANGHFDFTQIQNSISGIRDYFKPENGGKAAYLRKLKELGVVYDTPYAGEMMDLLNDSNLENTLFRKGPFKILHAVNNFAQKFYQYGDDFWKIMGFENEKAMLMKYQGMSEQQAEIEAAERIRNTYPTYSLVPKLTHRLRRFPLVGTFVSFPSEIIRTSYHILRYLKQDWKKHPVYTARKVAGLAFVAGAAHTAQLLTKAWHDVSDDEEEAVRDLAPEWQKNSNFFFTGRDSKGRLRYWDMSFLDPYNYWKRPINAMMRNEPTADKVKSAVIDMWSPFFGEDIAAGTIVDIYKNKTDYGSPVFNPQEPALDQATDIANYILKNAGPGFYNNAERMTKAMTGYTSPSGKQYTVQDELYALFGFRMTTFEPGTGLYYASYSYGDNKRNATKILNRALRDPNKTSDRDLEVAYRASRRAWDQSYVDMIRVIEAARKSGMTETRIALMLDNSSIADKDWKMMMAGMIPPFRLTKQNLRSSIKKSGALHGEELSNEITRRFLYVQDLIAEDYSNN